MPKKKEDKFILWFSEIGNEDVPLVGGKGASLGEMLDIRVNVPEFFVVSTSAYQYFVKEGGIGDKLAGAMQSFQDNTLSRNEASLQARRLILATPIPIALQREIVAAYREMERTGAQTGEPSFSRSRLDVAVRSSAVSEDMEGASHAGQLESYLNIRGEEDLLDAVRRCFASNFTSRVMDYRSGLGFERLDVGMAVVVQQMVRSDKASSGIAFTIDSNTGFEDIVLINAGFGLGEPIVGGQVNTDEYIVSKSKLKEGFRPIIGHTVVEKKKKMIYAFSEGTTTAFARVPRGMQRQPALAEDEILTIARWSIAIEEHYGKPMDFEWAKNGHLGDLFFVQARPATGTKQSSLDFNQYVSDAHAARRILSGSSVGDKIVHGRVRIVDNFQESYTFQKGEILVTHMTSPSWEPIMRMARAVVTNQGGRKCHAALVAGEMKVHPDILAKGEAEKGIPCIVGTLNATDVLRDGQMITVDCSQGEVGFVYDGAVPFHMEQGTFREVARPKTQTMRFANTPLGIFGEAHIPSDGIGLARTEFVVTEILRSVHPMAWVNYPDVPEIVKQMIDEYASHYSDKGQYFVDKLAEAWGRICAAFHPNPVIMRFSDFKSNEYADLHGGAEFEPHDEANPMLGLRGAARYMHPRYRDAFRLECLAVLKAREEFGFKNLIPMIPFCRTPEEGKQVLELMKQYGLEQGKDGLAVYVMIEIPSNVFLADQFADIFDGFSIGSNDLTQLIYGIDRDSGELVHIADESHKGIQRAIKHVIETAHKKGVKVGICGEAPSYLMDFTRFLVKCGVDSITITSGSLRQYKEAIEAIRRFEEELQEEGQ